MSRRVVRIAALACILAMTACEVAHNGFDVKSYGKSKTGALVTDGSVDCTDEIGAMLDAGGTVTLPPGIFLVHRLDAFRTGSILRGSGPMATTLKGNGTDPVIESTGHWFHSARLEDIGISGLNQPGEIGIHLHDMYSAVNYGGPHGLHLKNVMVRDVGGNGVVIDHLWCSHLEDVQVWCGGDAFRLGGGNTNRLSGCYAHAVGTGCAGYRINGGQATLIGCNGLDTGADSDWGVFGLDTAVGDASVAYLSATLMGCNIEDFRRNGLLIRTGSRINIRACSFVAPDSGTVAALRYGYNSTSPTLIDASTSFYSMGAAWANGRAIHMGPGMSPVIIVGDGIAGQPTHAWSDAYGINMKLPVLTVSYPSYATFQTSLVQP